MESDENQESAGERGDEQNGVGAVDAVDAETPDEARSLPPMDVYDLLNTTISLLSNSAWAWIGLSPNPFTGKMERDLNQAKIAIDSVAYLAGQVESHLDDTERREMQNLVSMLRVNYVQQLAKP